MNRLSNICYAVKMADGQWALVIRSRLQKGRWPTPEAATAAFHTGEYR